jgi:hypothetical protein
MIKTDFIAIPGDWNAGFARLDRGLVIKMTNTTAFDLTELDISISAKGSGIVKHYPVTRFLDILEGGGFYSALPEPGLLSIIKAGESR